MTFKATRALMCDEGWPSNGKPNPLACVECESVCLGGVEYLKKVKEDDFRALLCGADCDTCRQPCNLRRIALMRKIKPHVVRPRKKPQPKTWMEIAMVPYLQRREQSESHSYEQA